MVFYFHDAKLLSITATWRMMECCPRLVVGCPVAVATRHGCHANVTPNLCEQFLGCMRHHEKIQQKNHTSYMSTFVCMPFETSVPHLFYFPEPVMKIQGGAGTLNASALSGIPTVTGRDSELMVFSSWMMDDKGLRRHFDVVQKYMYHREFIYRCFDHFWWTLDTLRHLFGTQYNWQLTGFSRMECDPLFAKSVFAWIQWNIE